MKRLPFEYAYRNLWRGKARLAATVAGAALVVLLALAAGGFLRGMNQSLSDPSGLTMNVILLGAGSEESIERSQISMKAAGVAAASIRGIREEGGRPLVSPEIHAALPVKLDENDDEPRQAVIRGVEPVALLVHPEVEIVEGRFPTAGRFEVMAGELAATRMGTPDEKLAVGEELLIDGQAWRIVGRFTAPATVMDAELWIPLTDIQTTTRRESSVSCVILTLDQSRGGNFDDVDLFAKSRLDLELTAITQNDYYRSIAAFYRPIRIMVIGTAVMIAMGGLLGGLNTMYAAFAARVREVGMLRTLGFGRRAVLLSLTQESLLASLAGGLIAVAIGLIVLDGVAVRFSMGAFAIAIDAPVVLSGLIVAIAVGLIGVLPPAVRCLRLGIAESLKSI